jgi:ATP-dependent DNA ligase
MLARLGKEPPDSADWLVEPKYDGIRCISYGGKLINRSIVDVTSRFPEVHTPPDVVLDGELVCYTRDVPDFQKIQRRMNRQFDIEENAAKYPAHFIAFDVLEILGKPIIDQPLFKRKQLLYSCEVETAPAVATDVLSWLHNNPDWEGAMAKRVLSKYRPGSRTVDWLKFKSRKTRVLSVYGLTPGLGHRSSLFGSMILGIDGLHVGDVGTGFTDDEAADMLSLFAECRVEAPTLPYKGPVLFYTVPVIKVLVSYIEITNAGQLRHPAFMGLANV